MSLSGAGRRAKGVKGELEVKQLFGAHGFAVRGLEGEGDHIATRKTDEGFIAFHLEVKRQERLRIPEWYAQASSEAPEGFVPQVCFRRSQEPWMSVLETARLLELLR